MDERDDLIAVLIAEDPIRILSQIVEGGDFVGIDENDDVFDNLLRQ